MVVDEDVDPLLDHEKLLKVELLTLIVTGAHPGVKLITGSTGNAGVYFYKVDSVTLQDEVLVKEGFIHVVY